MGVFLQSICVRIIEPATISIHNSSIPSIFTHVRLSKKLSMYVVIIYSQLC